MELLERHFDTAFDAPDGIKKLREFILTLAMQGKLVPQDPKDEPASELLKEIEAEKKRLVKQGKIKGAKPSPPVSTEEAAYSLPQGWEWVRMGEVCSYIQRGKSPAYVDNSPFRVISQKCVRWWGLELEPARFIDPASLKSYEETRFLLAGDLLWNSTGTGTIGRACLVPSELEGENLVADSHVTIVRPLRMNNEYLWRWIQSPFVQNEIENSASGTTNQIELNTSTIVNYPIPIAPPHEQARIVAKIDELMARCDALEKLTAERDTKRLAVHSAAVRQLLNVEDTDGHIQAREFLGQHFGELYTVKENVTELRKAVLQLAVMGKLVPQDPNDPPASELLKQIETEKKRLVKEGKIRQPKSMLPIPAEEGPFPLPRGWAWARFASFATEIATGPFGSMIHQSDYVTGGVPLVNPSHMIAGRIIHDPEIAIPESMANDLQTYSLQENDIVMARRGEMGRCALVTAAENGFLCGTGSFILRFISIVDRKYILNFFRTGYCRDHLGGNSVGTTMTNLNQGILDAMPIPVPPAKEQGRIVAKIDQLMTMCDTLEEQIDAASKTQSALLNAMMAQYGGQRCA